MVWVWFIVCVILGVWIYSLKKENSGLRAEIKKLKGE